MNVIEHPTNESVYSYRNGSHYMREASPPCLSEPAGPAAGEVRPWLVFFILVTVVQESAVQRCSAGESLSLS